MHCDFSILPNIFHIDLYENQLSGSIPPELGNCAAMKTLYLSKNQLTGDIPPELGKCTALENLYLQGNQLGGSIPPEIAQCAALKKVNLSENQICSYLHGSEVRSIPPELGQCTALTGLWLQKNQLRGSLPLELAECKALTTLDVQSNQLTGPVPDLSACSSLKLLALSGNENLSASDVPAAMAACTDFTLLAAEEALAAEQRAAGGPVVETIIDNFQRTQKRRALLPLLLPCFLGTYSYRYLYLLQLNL